VFGVDDVAQAAECGSGFVVISGRCVVVIVVIDDLVEDMAAVFGHVAFGEGGEVACGEHFVAVVVGHGGSLETTRMAWAKKPILKPMAIPMMKLAMPISLQVPRSVPG
jgi:hypothetical protein